MIPFGADIPGGHLDCEFSTYGGLFYGRPGEHRTRIRLIPKDGSTPIETGVGPVDEEPVYLGERKVIAQSSIPQGVPIHLFISKEDGAALRAARDEAERIRRRQR